MDKTEEAIETAKKQVEQDMIWSVDEEPDDDDDYDEEEFNRFYQSVDNRILDEILEAEYYNSIQFAKKQVELGPLAKCFNVNDGLTEGVKELMDVVSLLIPDSDASKSPPLVLAGVPGNECEAEQIGYDSVEVSVEEGPGCRGSGADAARLVSIELLCPFPRWPCLRDAEFPIPLDAGGVDIGIAKTLKKKKKEKRRSRSGRLRR